VWGGGGSGRWRRVSRRCGRGTWCGSGEVVMDVYRVLHRLGVDDAGTKMGGMVWWCNVQLRFHFVAIGSSVTQNSGE
jgi:hypothetical protein